MRWHRGYNSSAPPLIEKDDHELVNIAVYKDTTLELNFNLVLEQEGMI